MGKEKSYKIQGTDGNEYAYSYKEIYDLVYDYMRKSGKFPLASEVDKEIPIFLKRFKKVVNVVEEEPQQETAAAE